MLFELEPAKEVTGGAWYNAKGDFDTEFVEKLYLACFRIVQQGGINGVNAEYVTSCLKKSGVFIVDLTTEDIACVLNAMSYDGVIEPVPADDEDTVVLAPLRSGEMKEVHKKRYRAVPSGSLVSEFTTIPCSRCPVISQCSEDGVISPKTCQYFTKWLSF